MSLLRPFALSLIGLTTGLAQDETPLPPGGVLIPPSNPGVPPQVPANPANPGVPPQVPANPANPGVVPAPGAQPAAAAVPLADQRITEAIIEPKLSGTQLAGLYRKYTGRRVIVSAAAALAEFSFVQDASPTDFLTFGQAAELLKKAATIENFVFVPDASDPNLDILTISTGGINPRSRGISIFTESDTLPEGDAVISYVMNLQYLKPDEAVRTFTAIIGQFGTYGSIAPVANAAAVVITENTSLIRKLIDLKAEIDKPSSQVGTRFIKVEYADVTELATTLNELLTAQQSAQSTAGVQRADLNNPAGNVPPVGGVEIPGQPGGSSNGEATPVQIIAEPRTNRLFAMGRPVDLLFIEGLVREFDIQSDQRNFLRRKLKFLKVSEFLPIAGDALTRAYSGTGEGGAAGAAGGGGGAGGAGAAGGGNRGNTGRSNTAATGGRANTNASNFGGGGGAGGSSSSATGSAGLGDPNISTAPESLLVARTLLVADNITNSVVVQGPPSGVELIEKLLDEIDVKPDQVMISCVFGQLALNEGYSFGVDYVNTLNGNLAGRGGSGSGGVVDLRGYTPGRPASPGTTQVVTGNGTTTTTTTGATAAVEAIGTMFDPGNLAAAAGLDLYGRIGNNLHVYLNAKQNDSNFKVLSRPTIFTSNGQKGSIISGTQIAVPTNSFSSGVSTTASTNYEYKDVALQLEVIPLINSRDEVTLEIALTSDDVGTDRSVGTGDTAYLIPDILKRELITTVTVPNKETIVLGGLITETTNDGRSGIPVLSRLPVVGALFGTKTKSTDRSELLIFIQPSIVHGEESLNDAQVDMDSRYKTAADTRRFGDGPGVLPPPDGIVLPEKGTATSTTTTTTVTPAPNPKKSSYIRR